jgi:predicted aspartyl protease
MNSVRPSLAQAGRLFAATILLFCIATSAAAETPAEITRVDFTLGPRGHILLPVSVNGSEPGIFALDTAASANVIHPRFAKSIGLDFSDSDEFVAHGAHSDMAVRPTRFESMSIGGLEESDVDAAVIDLSYVEGPDMQLDGLIGAPFLRKFDISIDFENQSVEFVTPRNVHSGGGHRFGLEFGALIYLDVVLNDQAITAVLDTGAGRSAINFAAAEALGINTADIPDSTHGHGAATMHQPAAAIPDVTLELGDSSLSSSAHVGIVDMPVFASLGLSDKPAMILGTNFLENRKLEIDYQNAMLYLDDHE